MHIYSLLTLPCSICCGGAKRSAPSLKGNGKGHRRTHLDDLGETSNEIRLEILKVLETDRESDCADLSQLRLAQT